MNIRMPQTYDQKNTKLSHFATIHSSYYYQHCIDVWTNICFISAEIRLQNIFRAKNEEKKYNPDRTLCRNSSSMCFVHCSEVKSRSDLFFEAFFSFQQRHFKEHVCVIKQWPKMKWLQELYTHFQTRILHNCKWIRMIMERERMCVCIEMQNHQDNSSSLACIPILFDEIKIYIHGLQQQLFMNEKCLLPKRIITEKKTVCIFESMASDS